MGFEYTYRWAQIEPGDTRLLEARDRELELYLAAPPVASGGVPPTANLYGVETLTDDYSDTGLTATLWQQSAGMDAFVDVDATNGFGTGHRVNMLANCDVMVSMYALHHRVGATGELFAGVEPNNTVGGGNIDLWIGSWANSSFPAAMQYVGAGCAAHYACDNTTFFDPHAFIGGIGSNQSFHWKLTVTLLEDTTVRAL